MQLAQDGSSQISETLESQESRLQAAPLDLCLLCTRSLVAATSVLWPSCVMLLKDLPDCAGISTHGQPWREDGWGE